MTHDKKSGKTTFIDKVFVILAAILILYFTALKLFINYCQKFLKGKFWEETIYYPIILIVYGPIFGLVLINEIRNKQLPSVVKNMTKAFTAIVTLVTLFAYAFLFNKTILQPLYEIIISIICWSNVLSGIFYIFSNNNKNSNPEKYLIPVSVKRYCKFIILTLFVPAFMFTNYIFSIFCHGEMHEEIVQLKYSYRIFSSNRYGNEYTLKFENGASIFYGRIYYSDVQYGDYIKVKTKKGLFGMPVLINTDEIPLTAEEIKEYKVKKQQNTK
jgi:hypothetical protein